MTKKGQKVQCEVCSTVFIFGDNSKYGDLCSYECSLAGAGMNSKEIEEHIHKEYLLTQR